MNRQASYQNLTYQLIIKVSLIIEPLAINPLLIRVESVFYILYTDSYVYRKY